MRKLAATTCLGFALLTSCGGNGMDDPMDGNTLANPNTSTGSSGNTRSTPIPTDGKVTIIASVGALQVTSDQLLPHLLEAYGLQFTLHLMHLEIAKQFARNANIIVTPEDFANERQRTLDQLFKDNIPVNPKLSAKDQAEYTLKEQERLLEQFLVTQRISMPEFNIGSQTAAVLRKVALPRVRDSVTDEQVRNLFNALYGEKVWVRHIKLANRLQATEALKLIFDKKQTFEQVAKNFSLDESTRDKGGEMPRFSRAETRLPMVFIEAAFDLKNKGDISDIISIDKSDGQKEIQLIQLIDKIPPPKAVKFEDHKDICREMLVNTAIQFEMKNLNEQIRLKVQNTPMIIHDSAVRKQYAEYLEKMGSSSADADQVRKSLEAQRRPSTQPEPLRPPAK